MARNVVAEIGGTAAQGSAGLSELARISLSHAEEAGARLARKRGLALPVPISLVGESKFPVLGLCNWASFLVNRSCWHIVCGLLRPDPEREQKILSSFWDAFYRICPTHEIFGLF